MSKARSPRESCSITIGITVIASPLAARGHGDDRSEREAREQAAAFLRCNQSDHRLRSGTRFAERPGTSTLSAPGDPSANQGSSGAAGSGHQLELNPSSDRTPWTL